MRAGGFGGVGVGVGDRAGGGRAAPGRVPRKGGLPARLGRLTGLLGPWRLGGGLLLVVLALGADFLASGRPVLARLRGELRLFPNLTRPADVPADLDGLRAAMVSGDWYVPALVPYAPDQSRVGGEVRALRPPSARHWLGTDRAGCDVFARLVHGVRASLGVGLLTAVLALLLGVPLGAAAGAGGRLLDGACSRLAEAFAAFPPLVLLAALQALSHGGAEGVAGLVGTALALAVAGWPHYFRLAREAVAVARAEEYALAAVALGASRGRLLWRHLLPAAWPRVATAAAFTVPTAILLEASLAYLGVGAAVGGASLGELLGQAGVGVERWWLLVFPGLTLGLAAGTLLALAEGLRRHLDPRPSALGELR